MRKIDLDFHRPAVRRNTRTGFLLLLLGVTTVAWLVILHNETREEQRQIRQLISQGQGNGQRSAVTPQASGSVSELQHAALVIEQLSFPWAGLFRAIEGNASDDMALLSIQPDITSRTVMLEAEAKDWGGMVSYIKRLEEDHYFSEVHVVSHQTQQSDPQRPVRFKLSCAWDSSISTVASSVSVASQQ